MTLSSSASAFLQQAGSDVDMPHKSSPQLEEEGAEETGGDVMSRAELLIRKLALAKKGGSRKDGARSVGGGNTTGARRRRTGESSKKSHLASTPPRRQQYRSSRHGAVEGTTTTTTTPSSIPRSHRSNPAPDYLTATTTTDELNEDDSIARSLLSGCVLDTLDDDTASIYSKSSTKDMETKLLDEARTRALAAEQDGALEEAGLQADLAEVNAREMERAMATWMNGDGGGGVGGVVDDAEAISPVRYAGPSRQEEGNYDPHSARCTTTTTISAAAEGQMDDVSSVGSGSAFSYGGQQQRQHSFGRNGSSAAMDVRASLAELLRRESGGGGAETSEALRSLMELPDDDAQEEGEEEEEDVFPSPRKKQPFTNTNEDGVTLFSVASASAREERSAVDAAEEQARKMAEEVSLMREAASSVASQEREDRAEVSPTRKSEMREDGAHRQSEARNQNKGTINVWKAHWSDEHQREYYHNPKTNEVRWDRPTDVDYDAGAVLTASRAEQIQQPLPSATPAARDVVEEEEDDEYSVPVSDYTRPSCSLKNGQTTRPQPMTTDDFVAVAKETSGTTARDDYVPVSDYTAQRNDHGGGGERTFHDDMNGDDKQRALCQIKKTQKRQSFVGRISVLILMLTSLSAMGYLVFAACRVGQGVKEGDIAVSTREQALIEGIDPREEINSKVRDSKTKKKKTRDVKAEPKSSPASPTGSGDEKKKKKTKKKRKKKTTSTEEKIDIVDHVEPKTDEKDSATRDIDKSVGNNIVPSIASYGAMPVFFFPTDEKDKPMQTKNDNSCADNDEEARPSSTTTDAAIGPLSLFFAPTESTADTGSRDDAAAAATQSIPPEEAKDANSSHHLDTDDTVTTTMTTAIMAVPAEEETRRAIGTAVGPPTWRKMGCRVPFVYILSTECRNFVTERPLFDLQSLTDSMMQ